MLLGVIRQEVLTGISDIGVFERIASHLENVVDLAPDSADYQRAAAFANECTRQGIAPTPIDMLLCAVAAGRDLPILTLDQDFPRYATHVAIRLFEQP